MAQPVPHFLLSFCTEKSKKANRDWEISTKSKLKLSSSFQIISFICSTSLSSLHVHLWLVLYLPIFPFGFFRKQRSAS